MAGDIDQNIGGFTVLKPEAVEGFLVGLDCNATKRLGLIPVRALGYATQICEKPEWLPSMVLLLEEPLDALPDSLSRLSGLTSLDLWDNGIGAAGAESLFAAWIQRSRGKRI